jgi:hypothetical protein
LRAARCATAEYLIRPEITAAVYYQLGEALGIDWGSGLGVVVEVDVDIPTAGALRGWFRSNAEGLTRRGSFGSVPLAQAATRPGQRFSARSS